MNPLIAMTVASATQQAIANFQRQSKIEKALWVLGTVGLVGFAAKKFYDNFMKTSADKEAEDITKDLSALTIKKNDLTINEGQARLAANSLLEAMDRIGTDYPTILRTLSNLQTQADLLYVVRAFGAIPYGYYGKADTMVAKATYSNALNLIGWLKKELSGSKLAEIRDIFLRFEVPF